MANDQDKPPRNWRGVFVVIVLGGIGVIRLFEMWVQGGGTWPGR